MRTEVVRKKIAGLLFNLGQLKEDLRVREEVLSARDWYGLSIDDVAAGKADAKIDALLDTLTVHNRPVFLRLGYGFDDPANGYVSAWKKFHERIQAKGSVNVALVWESTSCEESSIAEWYPGDEFVDWVGMLYCHGTSADEAIQFATDNNDVVHAATYINNDNSRIDLNDEILKKRRDETKQTFWLRASPYLFGILGFVE